MDVTPSAELSAAVADLLKRSAGRAELIIHYRASAGYELVSANISASLLFEMPPQSFSQPPRPWEQLPIALATYLAQALSEFTGQPEEVMPDYRGPNPGDTPITPDSPAYKVTLYHSTTGAGSEANAEHWYLFCLERADLAASHHRSKVESGKLENIGELASGVAHDFNNLIMGIQANAESILSDQDTLKDTQKASLINIVRACSSGTALTRSLLGYAKRQPLAMTQFNLVDMVNDVLRIDALALDAAHELVLDPNLASSAPAILVNGCYSSISHCLLNLLKNAREAMPRGGKVQIHWEGNDQIARLVIRDNGVGISKEDLSQIFQPFYSTKKSGTGLGLAMVKGIMSQHEGTAEITSEAGVGTSVTLAWPRKTPTLKSPPRGIPAEPRKTTDEIMKSKATTTPVAIAAKTSRLAFVIDDDDLVRGGVQGLLQHLGYKVEGYGRGEAAIAALSAQHVPKLILVDYHMPGMDGSEFIRYWYSELPPEYREVDTQILLVSGHPPTQFQEIIRKYSEHNVGLLQKPFSMETLQKKLIDFSALRSITSRIRPNTIPGRPVPIGNPSMRNAVIKPASPAFRTGNARTLPRPRIASDSMPPDATSSS